MRLRPHQRSPVVALTVVDSATLRDGAVAADSKVLVVARDARSNPTHPDVVSVPTQRIPDVLFDALAGDLGRSLGGQVMLRQSMARVARSTADDTHDPLVFAVQSLLARKLGLADALERGLVPFSAGLHTLVRGRAMYDNLGDGDVYEEIDMLSVCVALADPEWSLPPRTASYLRIAWTSVSALLATIESKDPGDLEVGLDPIELCVHGVCLEAARTTLSHLLQAAPPALPPIPSVA